MARKSLRPQLNQIRTWVRQGRTDAWIAHQLEVTVKDIDQFKREHGLTVDDTGEFDERDLRAEDDALVAAELDAIEEEAEEEDADEGDTSDEDEDGENGDKPKTPRRRGRRGGRRRRAPRVLEGTFDHGEEGYGLWLDPAIQDNGIYAEHWAGHRSVTISVEADRIVITRSGEQGEDDADGDDDSDA